MPNPTLQAPDQPLALRRSHLLSPAPDRLTNTPTTLRIIRENTLSGRDFTVHQLRSDEELSSPRRSTLLYTVFGRLWSSSQHREIRDTSGRPLLELRRIWWRGQWTLKRPGGVGEDLLSAELRWGIGMKIAVRCENALISGRWDRDELAGMERARMDVYRSPHPRQRRHTHSYYPRRRRRTEEVDAPPPYTPPPYSAVIAEDHARRAQVNAMAYINDNSNDTSNANSDSNGDSNGGSGAESDSSLDEDKARAARVRAPAPAPAPAPLPSYESVRRLSSTSLRDLLDAIEPPGEPAPASTSTFPPPRPRSEGAVDTVNANVDLKVLQLSGTGAIVTMGQKRIIHIRRERALDPNLSGSMPRWEVEVAEGVDLLLVR